MSKWTHRSCERCFVDRQIAEQDDGDQWLTITIPVLINQSEVAKDGPGFCCFCGQITVIGLYARHDPATLNCSHEE